MGVPAERTRAAVTRLRAAGRSYSQISAELGVSKGTVAYHARRAGVPVDERAARRYDWAQIQTAYDSGLSVRDCAAKFGFSHATWHAAVNRGAVVSRPAELPIEVFLVVGRTQTNRKNLKERLIKAGLKEDRCERCGLDEWEGAPLSPQVHHRNGEGLDNRLENLQLLCPNCHSQTDNWGGRNRQRSRLTPPSTGPPADQR